MKSLRMVRLENQDSCHSLLISTQTHTSCQLQIAFMDERCAERRFEEREKHTRNYLSLFHRRELSAQAPTSQWPAAYYAHDDIRHRTSTLYGRLRENPISQIFEKLNACANSVYKALSPIFERLGTRLVPRPSPYVRRSGTRVELASNLGPPLSLAEMKESGLGSKLALC